MFAVAATAYTDGTYAFALEEGEDSGLSDAVAIPTAKLIGTLAGLTLAAATAETDILPTIGVFSNKRYVRINAVSTAVTTGAEISVIATQRGETKPV